jgi:hypothetical protein
LVLPYRREELRAMNAWRAAALSFLIASLWTSPAVVPQLHAQETSCAVAKLPAAHSAWESSDRKLQILFNESEITLRKEGALSIAQILSREACKLHVRYQGLQSTWTLLPGEGTLQLKGLDPEILQPLPQIPPALNVNLAVFPSSHPVIATAEVKGIEAELLRRVGNDQASLKDPARKSDRPFIMADNLEYLRSLTHRVGWIDIPRFGKSSASAAILIAKHGSDLSLMKAALPIVEADVVQHGGSGEMYSVLYDELQITLGNRQRYGTQIDTDKDGHPYILPLENLEKVDQYRKEIGILSFKDYLKLVGDNMGGVTPRVAGSDE